MDTIHVTASLVLSSALPIADEEAELLEQAARIDAVSQNEFVRQAVLDRIAARKAIPRSRRRSAVRSRLTSGSSSGSRRRDRSLPLVGGLPPHRRVCARPARGDRRQGGQARPCRVALHAPQATWGGVEFYRASP